MAPNARARAANRQSNLASTPSPEATPSGTPSSSFSSDKENRQLPPRRPSSTEKRKQGAPARTMETPGSKRRKVSSNRLRQSQSNAAHQNRLMETNDTDFYDPDQNLEERRAVRKGLRDLTTKLNDSRSEYLKSDSHGLRDTIEKANEFFKSVKQTSDATIDSRLLLSAADLSYKRTAHAVLGDASTSGIDVDEFVSKCITFMREAPANNTTSFRRNGSSQRRRGRASGRSQVGLDDSDEEEELFNWDWLGRQACFPHNSRPSLPGFLLGPLSVQKKVRHIAQRRARQERIDPSKAVRPEDLKATDTNKQETADLTKLCTEIRETLVKIQKDGESRAQEELSQIGEPTDDIAMEIMKKYYISDTGGVPLLPFCINPQSFGQTVENMFYVSFLIRDGSMGVTMDSNNLPTLLPSEPAMPSEAKLQGLYKHQAIFTLDFETWEDIIETFDIKEPLIRDRTEEEKIILAANRGNGSWHS